MHGHIVDSHCDDWQDRRSAAQLVILLEEKYVSTSLMHANNTSNLSQTVLLILGFLRLISVTSNRTMVGGLCALKEEGHFQYQ